MTIYFTNTTQHLVVLYTKEGEVNFLPSLQTVAISCENSEIVEVSVRRNCESMKKSNMYHLIVETKFCLLNVLDGENFHITREKIRFSLNAFYDRLFLIPKNAIVLSENYKIVSEDKIKQVFNKSKKIHMFLTGPLSMLTSKYILILMAGIGLTFIWGWKFAAVFFPTAYLIVFMMSWLIDKFWSKAEKKFFKFEDEKEEFYSYFEDNYIRNYYSNINRKPYMGKIETD